MFRSNIGVVPSGWEATKFILKLRLSLVESPNISSILAFVDCESSKIADFISIYFHNIFRFTTTSRHAINSQKCNMCNAINILKLEASSSVWGPILSNMSTLRKPPNGEIVKIYGGSFSAVSGATLKNIA